MSPVCLFLFLFFHFTSCHSFPCIFLHVQIFLPQHGQHPQHYLHHLHPWQVLMRMMQVMLAMFPKDAKNGPGGNQTPQCFYETESSPHKKDLEERLGITAWYVATPAPLKPCGKGRGGRGKKAACCRRIKYACGPTPITGLFDVPLPACLPDSRATNQPTHLPTHPPRTYVRT